MNSYEVTYVPYLVKILLLGLKDFTEGPRLFLNDFCFVCQFKEYIAKIRFEKLSQTI